MASGASKLENDLVAFVESHPETFSLQDVVNMRRNIIASFALMEGIHNETKPGVGGLASMILSAIDKKLEDKTIITSQDVKHPLTHFDLCVEFLNRFLNPLCGTERDHIPGGYTGNPTPYAVCLKMRERVVHSTGHTWKLVNRKINEYQVKVLKLWADVLIHDGTITQPAIAEMKTSVSAKDGFERKMRELCGNPSGMIWGPPGHIKNNLDESVLLEFLTLFHVATPAQMTSSYGNIGPLGFIVFSVISQFVPLNMVNGTPDIPSLPTGQHNSKLNTIHLTCNVVAKPYQRTPDFVQSPIMAYLSSDVLDQCVQSVGRFPTTDEFLSERMIEKAAAFSAHPPPPSAAPLPSAPELSDLGGGRKKTRRNPTKKRKHSKKIRHEHRRN
jgi:hypothetical protein